MLKDLELKTTKEEVGKYQTNIFILDILNDIIIPAKIEIDLKKAQLILKVDKKFISTIEQEYKEYGKDLKYISKNFQEGYTGYIQYTDKKGVEKEIPLYFEFLDYNDQNKEIVFSINIKKGKNKEKISLEDLKNISNENQTNVYFYLESVDLDHIIKMEILYSRQEKKESYQNEFRKYLDNEFSKLDETNPEQKKETSKKGRFDGLKEFFPALKNINDEMIAELLIRDKKYGPSLGPFVKHLLSELSFQYFPEDLKPSQSVIPKFNKEETEELTEKLIPKIIQMRTVFRELYYKHLSDLEKKGIKTKKEQLSIEDEAAILAFEGLIDKYGIEYKPEASRIVGLYTNKMDCDLLSDLFVELAASVGLNYEIIHFSKIGEKISSHSAVILKKNGEQSIILETTALLDKDKRNEKIIPLYEYAEYGFDKYRTNETDELSFPSLYGIGVHLNESRTAFEKIKNPQDMKNYIEKRIEELKQDVENIFCPEQAYSYLLLVEKLLINVLDRKKEEELKKIKEKIEKYLQI